LTSQYVTSHAGLMILCHP